MRKFNNYESVIPAGETVKIPDGGYVCRIIDAKIKEYKNQDGESFERLEIALDVCEGEYKDYYRKDFDNQSGEDKKWKGVLRLYVPSDDGSDNDEYSKRVFKGFTNAVEDSNEGYHWDWNEAGLKGLCFGCTFRAEEYDMTVIRRGAEVRLHGWTAKPFRAMAADKIREGKFNVPNPKYLPETNGGGGYPNSDVPALSDEEVPF